MAGQRTHLIYPTGQTVTYTHDAAGRLTQVLDWSGGTTVYIYTDAGRLSGMARPNGVTSAYSYDAAGRLAQIEHHDLEAQLLARYTYTLDSVGNRLSVTETFTTPRSITYIYDALNRLTAAAYSTGESYGYQYDAVGNRTVMTDATGIYTYTYNAANRLTGIELPDSKVWTYTWDARGNLIHDGVFTYTYNAAGRMVRAESISATLVYTYNVDGLRIAQADVAYAGAQTYVWDWATGVPEMLYDGQYTYLVGHDTLGWEGARSPMAPVMWTFVLPDALGSVRQETDATGAVTAVREWSPYGEEIGGAQAGLGYTGEWFDTGAGLQYLRARWYDGGTGRFTSPDPIVPDYQNPPSIHAYAYVLGNPLRFTDPSGYIPLSPRKEIEDGTFQYSCNCGWMDWGHIEGGYEIAFELLRNVNAVANNSYDLSDTVYELLRINNVTVQENMWLIKAWMPLDLKGLYLGSVAVDAVVPSENLTGMNDRIAVALSIFMELEERFEAFQGQKWIWISRFAEDDLPSDLIGFYIALKIHSGEGEYEDISKQVRRMCDAMEIEDSLAVLDTAYKGSGMMRGFVNDWTDWNPRLAPLINSCDTASDCGACGRCPGSRFWPTEFSALSSLRVAPQVGGSWWHYRFADGLQLATDHERLFRLGTRAQP